MWSRQYLKIFQPLLRAASLRSVVRNSKAARSLYQPAISMNWSLKKWIISRKKIKLKKQRKSDLDQKEKNLQTNQFILSIRFFGSKHKHTLGGWSSEDVGFGFLHCFLFPYSPKIQAIFHVIWFVLASGKNLLLLSSTKQLQCKKEKGEREKRNNNMRNLNSQWLNTT